MTADAALHWLFALVAAAMLTAFAVLLVTGGYYDEGPVLVRIADGHGLHQGDVFVLTGWAAGVFSLSGLLLFRRRRASGGGTAQQRPRRRDPARGSSHQQPAVLGDEHVERQPGRPEEESHSRILGAGG